MRNRCDAVWARWRSTIGLLEADGAWSPGSVATSAKCENETRADHASDQLQHHRVHTAARTLKTEASCQTDRALCADPSFYTTVQPRRLHTIALCPATLVAGLGSASLAIGQQPDARVRMRITRATVL
jgi:hypothetical protein